MDNKIIDLCWKQQSAEDGNNNLALPRLLTTKGMMVLSEAYSELEENDIQPIIINSSEEFKQIMGHVANIIDVELSLVCNLEGDLAVETNPYNTAAIKVEKRKNNIHVILFCFCVETKEGQNNELDSLIIGVIKDKVEGCIKELETPNHKIHIYYQDSPFIKIDGKKENANCFPKVLHELKLLAPVYLFGCAKDSLCIPRLSNNLLWCVGGRKTREGIFLHKYQMPDFISNLSDKVIGEKSILHYYTLLSARYSEYYNLLHSLSQKNNLAVSGNTDAEDFPKKNNQYGLRNNMGCAIIVLRIR